MTAALARAAQAFLAHTPSQVLVVQLEDVIGVVEQANLPATVDTHPNWRRKLPLAPERYKVQFTVGRQTHDKLRRAQDLLRHSIPDGDPAAIFERAVPGGSDSTISARLRTISASAQKLIPSP